MYNPLPFIICIDVKLMQNKEGGICMVYLKLIALCIDDFESNIFCESNYGLNELERANTEKAILEQNGYFCILLKKSSDITI